MEPEAIGFDELLAAVVDIGTTPVIITILLVGGVVGLGGRFIMSFKRGTR